MKKSRILILVAIAVVLVVASIPVFVSCNNEKDNSKATIVDPLHEHIESDWIVDKNATSNTEGKKHKECNECGAVLKEEIIPMLKSTSEGLEFALNEDGESYYVKGIGTCTDTEIIIPSEHKGKPVTAIGEGAFAFFDHENEKVLDSNIIYVDMPDTIIDIRMGSFAHCSKMKNVTIGNSVEIIGEGAFIGCSSLTSIEIPDSVTSIGGWTFYGCTSLTSIEISDSVTSIGEWAFYGCTSLTSIEIPDSVTSIGEMAFRNCASLTSIVIPDSVTSFGWYATYGCDSLTIYCEAGSKPRGWHYYWNDANCPVVWGYKDE